ncbi:hypothetical protein G5B31_10345 [Rhodobacter sp. SGA-6-6]|uniref:hypothetical protein n=1 Tax=Rhodobacter sp. SGA-6-6 TaxID=2710882 RepID=UPI0013EC3BCB|nr:hypothetical protein [Rhodobacter sp. SGA-6-6]NGM45940.1 hypothetical protein [Rhodobacter sp. SGA-6-6]
MRFPAFLLAGLLALAPAPAPAHSGKVVAPGDGIAIASLSHGQMAVIARHRGEILALAARHYPPDDGLRRLTNYAALQHAWCLWGLMPGTIRDEASPFNLCAHAALAATRDTLLRLEELRPGDPEVAGLVRRVEVDMMAEGSALALCQYSGTAFDTATLIRPDWSALPRHWPSVAALLAVAALAAAGLAALRMPRRG